MTNPPSEQARERWFERAARTRKRFNGAAWLSVFLPALLALACVSALAILICRGHGLSLDYFWLTFSGVVLLAALGAWLAAKNQFISTADALVRLEVEHQLHGRLTSAAAGVGGFPQCPAATTDGYRWNLRIVGMYLLLPIVLLAAATTIPVRTVRASTPPVLQPLSMTQLEKLAEELEQESLVRESDVEKLKEQLGEIAKSDPKDWYSEKNLEAADNLHDKTLQSLESLADGLGKLGKTVDALASAEKLTQGRKNEISKELERAAEELERGGLRPSDELSEELRQLQEKQSSASEQQLQSLRGKLKTTQRMLKEQLKRSGSQGQGKGAASPKEGSESGKGQGQGNKPEQQTGGQCGGSESGGSCSGEPGKQGNGGGASSGENGEGDNDSGGVARGPGVAPLNLNERSPQITSDRNENLPEAALEHIETGDLTGIQRTKPDPIADESFKPHDAGTIGKESAGGRAVWVQSYTPEEAEILKRYFK